MNSQDKAPIEHVAAGARAGALVWQVDAETDYGPFAEMFARGALSQGKSAVYFRFAEQAAIDPKREHILQLPLTPQAGFEPFIDAILQTILERKDRCVYLFDCISPLAADWFSDQMVGNFFVIICTALRSQGAAACFSILRNQHSQYAVDPITQTAQALFDVCRHEERLYVQPLKIEYGGTNYRNTLHVRQDDRLLPVPDSHTAAAVLTSSRRDNLGLARHHLGVWSCTFVEAEALLQHEHADDSHAERVQSMRDRILRMAVTRDARLLRLVQQYFTLEDLVFLGTRMLGTGLIGGKAADMLLARAALLHRDPRWRDLLETHDSFFIPSDVFYTFLVQNDCWELRRQLLHAPERLDIAKEARRRILNGVFPPHIVKRFSDMLDYFGETPLAARSSSLLEDSFGNAFSGRYESVFCVNQGERAVRLEELIAAVKTVYASAMSKEALDYRAVHGLLDRDEQMAILVQRVSGKFHGPFFFPHLAAVGFSFNPYVWHEDIDPRSGVLRLVFGLGTRAVNRSDDDYTRLVALNAPLLRSDHHETDLPAPAQQWVDVLDLEQGQVRSMPFRELSPCLDAETLALAASTDPNLLRAARNRGLPPPAAVQLSFNGLLGRTDFAEVMGAMLKTLEEAFGTPVDIEVAVNFSEDDQYRIHLLQCRPMQVRGVEQPDLPVINPPREDILLQAGGPVIGRSRFIPIHFLLYVIPSQYAALPEREQYAVARIIGEINRRLSSPDARGNVMLIGPGRWGSTSPALGLPVSFTEINRAAVICEVLAIRDDLITEVSLGAHFFNDLVELDMLYMALTPGRPQSFIDKAFFENAPNRLAAYIPEAARYEKTLHLVVMSNGDSEVLRLLADTQRQQVCLYRDAPRRA